MTSNRRILVVSAAIVAAFGILLYLRLREPGRLKLPAGSHVPQISLGSAYGFVIAPDGSLWSWGGINWAALPYPQTNRASVPGSFLRRIDPDTNWVKVSAGSSHNLALKSDGTLWAWGGNLRGELGIGSGSTGWQRGPICSVPGNDWEQVEAARLTSYALKKDGTLWAWGLNSSYQLGIGTTNDSPVPVQVGSATNWTKVRGGGVSAAGIQSDGSLWIWGGMREFSVNSTNSENDLKVPTRASMDTNWVDVAVENSLWLAIKEDGSLWGFGHAAAIYTGAPKAAFAIPARIGTNSDWVSVSASGSGQMLRKRDGSFWKLEPPFWRPPGWDIIQPLWLPEDAVGGDTADKVFVVVTRDGEVRGVGVGLTSFLSVKTNGQPESVVSRLGRMFRPRTAEGEPWSLRNIDPGDPPK